MKEKPAATSKAKRKVFKVSDIVPADYNPRTIKDKAKKGLQTSLGKYGYLQDVVVNIRKGKNIIVGGHKRFEAMGLDPNNKIECTVVDLDEKDEKALNVALNSRHISGEFDEKLLESLIADISGHDSFNDLNFDDLVLEFGFDKKPTSGRDDKIPEEPKTVVIKKGDLIEIGNHRVLCGDSIVPEDVARLMNGEKAVLLHADPPYGMGKEKDGVENDNLYREKLDKFQIDWWTTFRSHIVDNASAYIWGNSPDLWRLWYKCKLPDPEELIGLESTERMELRNQIVWDKKSITGMKSDLMTQYPIATEHCLFIQIGQQFIGKINSEDYPEEYEVIRAYLAEQAESAGIRPKDIREVCNCQMYAHWFTKSQFTLISEKHYVSLKTAYPGHFEKPWSELKSEWDRVKGHGAIRSYFDNGHDIMRDVWDFPRVTGDERWEHATPKPVEMMERIMKSSCPKSGLVVEPFGGSGSTLIGAEKTDRSCNIMELTEKYVQIIVQRWCDFTGVDKVKINGKESSWKKYTGAE